MLANDNDPDGNPITVGSNTQPSHGTLALNADGSFTYTPNAGYAGQDTFTYTATDGTASSASTTVTLTVQAPAPQANPDVNTATPSTPATGNVLSNDLPDPASLSVRPGTFESTSGTFTLNSDGSYVYVLKDASDRPVGADNSDQIPYTVQDAQGRTSTSTLTVSSSNP